MRSPPEIAAGSPRGRRARGDRWRPTAFAVAPGGGTGLASPETGETRVGGPAAPPAGGTQEGRMDPRIAETRERIAGMSRLPEDQFDLGEAALLIAKEE